jgi:hypothetical protein
MFHSSRLNMPARSLDKRSTHMFSENVTPLLILLALTHVAAIAMIAAGLRGLRRADTRHVDPSAQS